MSVADSVEANHIELIRLLWVDHCGITRGKAVSRRFLAERMISGIGLAKVRQAANVLDEVQPVEGFNAVGEVRLVPDPATFVILPYAAGSAAMLCDLVDVEGRPWDACPRTFLKEAVAEAAALGFEVMAAFEPEFTLCRERPSPGQFAPVDDSLCFDNAGFDAANDFAVSLTRTLTAQGIDVELYHPEFGPGQHEMTIRHAGVLRAADAHVWQRAMTRGLAQSQGLWATFAPMPYPGFRGNGNHIHLSLWHDGSNAFSDLSDGLGLSKLAYHFVAGVLKHAAALTGLSCPSVNSYRRLQPRMWSGAWACYGPDNREAALRIPSRLRGVEAASTNLEFKACDAAANPYLAAGALLLAGLDGVRNLLDPGEPLAEDPNQLSTAQRRRRGVRALPSSLDEAIDALEHDELLMSALGPIRRVVYPAIKRSEVQYFRKAGEESEFFVHSVRY